MTRNSRLALAALGLFGIGLGLLGCERAYPEPDQDAVARSIRNARVNGKLRACWPAGQAYVEAVLKADGNLRAALGKPAPTLAILALPPKDDPAWRPEPDKDAAAGANERPQEQADYHKALEKLTATIDKLPAGLPDESEEAREEFKARVWDALAVADVPVWEFAEQAAAARDARRYLEARIDECKGALDEQASGLRFADEECQTDIDALHDELAAMLLDRQESFLDYAGRQMAQVHDRIGQVDKQKERDEYLYLDNQRTYFKWVLKETWLKGLQDRVTATKGALADHESGDEQLPAAKLEFLRADLPRLEAAQVELAERISAILNPPAGR